MENCNKCEEKEKNNKRKGFLWGILYGLLPHSFCIAFIIFSILGITAATTLLKPLLLNPYFFYILIGLSFIFAAIAAVIYLKKTGNLSLPGIKKKWKYLSILFGTTISINLILFMVIFPIMANLKSGSLKPSIKEESIINQSQSLLALKVQIPCPGHAPLITDEINKIGGVKSVKFKFPNLFDVIYDSSKTSQEKILSLGVFETYKAEVIPK